MQEVISTLEINGKTYQIARFDARTGSKLLARLMARLMSIGSKDGGEDTSVKTEKPTDKEIEENPQGMIAFLLLNLADADFDYVQFHALSVVNRLEGSEGTTPVPITKNGIIGAKDLKDDIDTIMELTRQSLFLNLSNFFTKAAIDKALVNKTTAAVSSELSILP